MRANPLASAFTWANLVRPSASRLWLLGLITLLSRTALAQDPTAPVPSATGSSQEPAPPPPSASTSAPSPPPPPPPEKREPNEKSDPVPQGQQGGASGAEAGSTFAADWKPRLLVPRYGEDYYPAMPKEDGLLRGIP